MSISEEPFAVSFPITLSLEYIVEEWAKFKESGNNQKVVSDLLLSHPALPDLLVDDPSQKVLEEHADLVYLLFSLVFPASSFEGNLGIATAPFRLGGDPVFVSNDVSMEILQTLTAFGLEKDNEFYQAARNMRAYAMIAEDLYDVPTDNTFPFILTLPGDEGMIERHYAISFDARFARAVEREGAPKLSKEQLNELILDRSNLEKWNEYLPPEYFEFRGVLLLHATDVTDNQVVSKLAAEVLKQDAFQSEEHLDDIQRHFATMMQAPDLQFGLIAMRTNMTSGEPEILPFGRTQLMCDGEMTQCNNKHQSIYMSACKSAFPSVYPNLAEIEIKTEFENVLVDKGFRSLVLFPIHDGDELLGMIELASPTPYIFDSVKALKLVEILSVFKTALSRSRQEFEDRIEAVIKRECTAIHPSVNWRFNQAARNYLERKASDEKVPFEDITFEDVYPMYGMSDIRGSSVQRNTAILKDLKKQIALADTVLREAEKIIPMPMIDEARFQLANHEALLDDGLDSGEELQILSFFKKEIRPIFKELKQLGGEPAKLVSDYRSKLNPSLGLVYEERKKFDESVMKLNEIIGLYIDARQKQAQNLVPHYFEMYKTDGVDYTIYAGSSLLRDGRFSKLHLQNLRLWQLTVTCEVIWELEQLKPLLDVPLECAHLLLVQDAPLSIRFRPDEKHFDVDGAYNVRYEIIKKRIDKAKVLGTGERITQPGMISIVYSQVKEAKEYKRYLNYLKAKKYIHGEIEDLEIEPLQGVHGLKALRVRATPIKSKLKLSDELLSQISSGGDGANVRDTQPVGEIEVNTTK